MFLAQHFDVSQFPEIEVAFLLQTIDSQVQILYLKNTAAATRTVQQRFASTNESVKINETESYY